MKTIVSAAVMLMGLAGSAAATTYQATLTDFQNNGQIASTLAALGADAGATEMVFTWTYDESSTPIAGPFVDGTSRVYTYLRYSSFSVEVGGVTINGMPTNSTTINRIYVKDGLSSGDELEVISDEDQAGPNSTLIDVISVRWSGSDSTIMSNVAHPTAAQLNSFTGGNPIGRIGLFSGGTYLQLIAGDGVVSELAAVPVPAALPMLLLGMGALWGVRRRVG